LLTTENVYRSYYGYQRSAIQDGEGGIWGLWGGYGWFTVLSLGRSLGLVRGLEGKRKDRGRVTEGKGGNDFVAGDREEGG
jgi:hypothetical protein